MRLLERTILRHLFDNEEYAERVLPFVKEEYFYDDDSRLIFRLYDAFFQKFKTAPQFAAIRIGLDTVRDIREQDAEAAHTALGAIEAETSLNADQQEWLLEQTEEFCQDRAIHVALHKSIVLLDDPEKSRDVIPDLLREALAVNFDTSIGHDFFEDADARYEFLHRIEERVPFDLDILNRVTRGGVAKKTLNVVLAGTNVGKSLFLCHMAAACVRMSKNVLYITCEMSEERIAERIEANLLNLPIDDLECLSHGDYTRKMQSLRQTSTGKLIIKEYPTGVASSAHVRTLLKELRLKQNFVPDIIIIDYLTICASARIKVGNAVNSYTLYKFVSEEFRGLAVEFDVPIFTAAQFNRKGHSSSDADITDIGESWAIAQTADLLFALLQTEELEQAAQIALQILKNRYGKKNIYTQELLGIDTHRMKLYDLQGAPDMTYTPAPDIMEPSGQKPTFRSLSSRRRPLSALKEAAQGESNEY